MGLFAALDGISPWWWVALAILLAAAEMVTVTTVLISAAVAALATAIGLWIAPGLGGAGQIAIFGLLSILFTFAGRWLVARYGDLADQSGTLNKRAARLIGREAVVTQFAAEAGQVTIDGMPWPARLAEGTPPPAPGDRVRVVAADGIVVWIRPL